jgi:hypothetical protein
MKFKTIEPSKLSTMAMVAGGEKRHPKIVHHGHVRHWVGIGWVNEGPAQAPRDNQLPRVKGAP